ncbi:MAG: hypothetical protein DDT41_01169 [candidate division WS2 bacterium]|nr:hypothetical protein [Candidatus Psychracetigena formicireducens]
MEDLDEKVIGDLDNSKVEDAPVVETTEVETTPTEEDTSGDLSILLEQNKRIEKEYAKLQKQFTKISQELATAKEDVRVVRHIRSNPDLTEQVNMLLESFPETIQDQSANVVSEAELKEYAEAWKYLAKQSDFDTNEIAIIEIAEEEGLNPDNPKDLRKAYRIWKGVNADKIAQDALLKGQKKVEQKEEGKKVPALQGTGGPGVPTQHDFVNMSAEEVLKVLGKTLFKEK